MTGKTGKKYILFTLFNDFLQKLSNFEKKNNCFFDFEKKDCFEKCY